MRLVYAFLPLSWRPGKLARDTVILTTGLGLRALAQGLVFVIVARVLGSQGYGAFSAALAIAGVWVHFCGLGGHVILMKLGADFGGSGVRYDNGARFVSDQRGVVFAGDPLAPGGVARRG